MPFKLLGDEAKGWLDTTYLSPRLRISRFVPPPALAPFACLRFSAAPPIDNGICCAQIVGSVGERAWLSRVSVHVCCG